MKAFERMEKAEQRKQENQAKQAQRKDPGESIPVIPTPIILPKKEQDKDDINRHINNERPKRRR